ncbi:MAG: hypothetical protein ABW321_20145 [Polyangiales bacterium]
MTKPTEARKSGERILIEARTLMPVQAAKYAVTAAEPLESDTAAEEHASNEEPVDAVFSEDEVERFAEGEDEDETEELALPGPPEALDAVFSEDEVERFAENEDGLPAGVLPMFGAFVLQKVENYDAWLAAFESRLSARKQAGFVAQGVMRGVFDPKLVAVWLAVTDVGLAKAYFADELARVRAKASDGRGKVRVQLSRNVAARMEPERAGLSAAIVVLRVDDLHPFRIAVEADSRARHAAGVLGYALSQDVDDESLVYLYLQSEEPSQLKRYIGSRRTKQLWRDAGVVSVSSLTVVREGELTLCQ